MVARLILFLFAYGVMFSLPLAALGFVYRRQLGEYVARRRALAQGRRNALVLLAHEERCFVCDETVVSHDDCYEPGKGWYHAKCLKALLG